MELIGRILKRSLVAFLGVSPYLRAAVVDVLGQDPFGAMHHEERHESCGPARCGV
jgi:hypothetical protein